MTIAELEREVKRLYHLIRLQDEEITELKKHSHAPFDFNPLLKRVSDIEAKMKEWQQWNGLR